MSLVSRLEGGSEVGRTGSGSCPVTDYGICDIEPSSSTAHVLE